MVGIKAIVINNALKEFYRYFDIVGEGSIQGSKGGVFLYDLIQEELDISADDKKRIWKHCKNTYYIQHIQYTHYPKEMKEKLLHEYYKVLLVEFHLNEKAKQNLRYPMIEGYPTDLGIIKRVVVE